jgi:hypothetical protein
LFLEILRQWLQNCDQNHRCNSTPQFWPTRVIDVGDPDSSKLSLVERTLEQCINERYVAVSHCWGHPTDNEKKESCTTKDNYQDRLNSFSIDNLPRTFQDAIYVTRAIGKKFLWIDAVCIIQGDESDWEAQAHLMEEVFSSAYCTIAADSATHWKQGFLQRRSPPHFTVVSKSGQEMYACDTKYNFEKDVNNSELNKRAWVLQERVLSRRILHFTENHTYFACGESVRLRTSRLWKGIV